MGAVAPLGRVISAIVANMIRRQALPARTLVRDILVAPMEVLADPIDDVFSQMRGAEIMSNTAQFRSAIEASNRALVLRTFSCRRSIAFVVDIPGLPP